MIVEKTGPIAKANDWLRRRRCSPFIVWGYRCRVYFAIAGRKSANGPADLFRRVRLGTACGTLTDSMTKEALYIDATTRCAEIAYREVPSCSRVLCKGSEKREREQQARTFQRKMMLRQNLLWVPPRPHDPLRPFIIVMLFIIQE